MVTFSGFIDVSQDKKWIEITNFQPAKKDFNPKILYIWQILISSVCQAIKEHIQMNNH